MKLNDINWEAPENSEEIRRPFTVKVEASVARNFIKAVQGKGLHVRETIVKLMRAFAEENGVKDENVNERRDSAA